MKSRSIKVDGANAILIVFAAVLSYILPFGLFLFSYAVLGPLHYLTEINWLNNKGYFLKKRPIWLGLAIATTLIMTIPKVVAFLGVSHGEIVDQLIGSLNDLSNPLLVLSVWVASVLVFIEEAKKQLIGFAIGGAVFIASFLLPSYVVLFGLLIPTVVHVYLFTILFMLHGAIRSHSQMGFITVIMMLCVPLMLFLFEPGKDFYNIPAFVKQGFVESGFHLTHIKLAQLLGMSDGKSFFFYGTWELKLQRFIAFAYTYHYLNWFSKTAIIGWHKGVNGNRFWVIISLWLAMVCLFLIDYRIGFYGALGLSFLHVLLELPLNAISVKSIWQKISG